MRPYRGVWGFIYLQRDYDLFLHIQDKPLQPLRDIYKMLKDNRKSAARVGATTTANPRNHCKASDGGILQPVCDCMPACDGWPKWYAVHTGAQSEKLAYGELRRAGYGVFYPTEKVERRAGRVRQHVTRPYFPRYMFMSVNEGDDHSRAWRVPGVACLVHFDSVAIEIPHEIMYEIMEKCDHKSQVRHTLADLEEFAVGDHVTLNSSAGAWEGFAAVISKVIDNKDRIKALIEIFGRPTEIDLSRASANHVTK